MEKRGVLAIRGREGIGSKERDNLNFTAPGPAPNSKHTKPDSSAEVVRETRKTAELWQFFIRELDPRKKQAHNFRMIAGNLFGSFTRIVKPHINPHTTPIPNLSNTDSFRRCLSFMLPITKFENHLCCFDIIQREHCTTEAKIKECIDSTLNSTRKLYHHERKKVGNITIFLISKNPSKSIKKQEFRLSRYAVRRAREKGIGGNTNANVRVRVKILELEDNWRSKIAGTLKPFLRKRMKGWYNSCMQKGVKPYGTVRKIINRLKAYIIYLEEIFERQQESRLLPYLLDKLDLEQL